jgi:hypothetical protein
LALEKTTGGSKRLSRRWQYQHWFQAAFTPVRNAAHISDSPLSRERRTISYCPALLRLATGA